MKPPMTHTAKKYARTRNAYGDYTANTYTQMPCHFRYINEVVTSVPNETFQSDAMAWFEPDADVQEQDLLYIDNTFFRVEKLIRARKLRSNSVQFIKCWLQKHHGTN